MNNHFPRFSTHYIRVKFHQYLYKKTLSITKILMITLQTLIHRMTSANFAIFWTIIAFAYRVIAVSVQWAFGYVLQGKIGI